MLHRLNVWSPSAEQALASVADEHRRVRFSFCRDRPDFVMYMTCLSADLDAKIVMPALGPQSWSQPPLAIYRFECGPNGNPHFHGMSYAHGNPRLDGVKEVVTEGSGVAEGAAEGGGAARLRVTDEGGEGSGGNPTIRSRCRIVILRIH